MQNHYISGDVADLKKKRAYWACRPTGVLIVFVHGLMGEAVGTWSNFESILLKSKKCEGCDLVFYKYNSTDARSRASSGLFYDYLKKFITTPATVINQDSLLIARRTPSFRYKKVILVAHSLGSVIARQALLQAHASKDTWQRVVELVLFAPAHLGATNIAGFVSEIASALKIPWVVSGAKLRWPVLEELQKDSEILKELSEKTLKAVRGGKATFLEAKKVVFGEFDRVVQIDNFCQDTHYTIFPGRNHRNVCKPIDTYQEPVEAVLERI